MYLGWLQPAMDPRSTESCKVRQISYTKTGGRRYVVEVTTGFHMFPLIVTYSYI